MNISNALYQFTDELVTLADINDPLKEVVIHADIYEEIKPGRTIRVDDVRQCKPVLTANGEIRRDNAIVNVHFLKMPDTQKLSDRLDARQISEDMADAWLKAFFKDSSLGSRVCSTGDVMQFNDWIRPGTVKIPVTVLRLIINQRK